MSSNDTNLAWIDLEMSGLDVDHDYIIEIATIITDKDLHILAEGPVFAIYQKNEILEGMDAWNTRQHNKSGLINRVKNSNINEQKAEKETLDFLSQYISKGKSPMCGNSVCQDRRFIHRFMPELEVFFHYRNLDVSTLKILAQLWKPQVAKAFNKAAEHTAQADIRDSIEELRYYRKSLLT